MVRARAARGRGWSRVIVRSVDSMSLQKIVPVIERAGGRITLRAGRVELNLAAKAFGDHGLAHMRRLTNLRVLILDGTQITDAGLASLAGMKDLEVLDVGRTPVSSAGLAHLREQVHVLVAVDEIRRMAEPGDKGFELRCDLDGETCVCHRGDRVASITLALVTAGLVPLPDPTRPPAAAPGGRPAGG